MREEVSHGTSSRKRIAPNVYRRTWKGVKVVYEVAFRDVDAVQRQRRLAARTDKAAIREARTILSDRDGGERVVAADVTLRGFVAAEYTPLIDSLAAAGRRSAQGVNLDKNYWRL